MSRSVTKRFIDVVDSHTGGEPTRIVMAGGPSLVGQSLAECRDDFLRHHDGFRSTVVNEPRGSDVLVGGLLTEPDDPSCETGVIFFNNVGPLKMCGHGTIGLAVTLAHLGRMKPGRHGVSTPVGPVFVELHDENRVSVENVASFRHRDGVTVDVPGVGAVTGDIAWGGNWFFLVDAAEHDDWPTLEHGHVEALTSLTTRIRRALVADGITGADGGEIDHIELFAPARPELADARNFVLCPGGAYDRSPCGTGTSAKLACLVADGKLRPGEVWRQASIIGSVFEGEVRIDDGRIIPRITGTAYVTAEARLIVDEADPFRQGIPSIVIEPR